MKATFYKHGSNISGFYTQREVVDNIIENITRKELIALCNPYLRSKSDYYQSQSTDINGDLKKTFELQSHLHTIIVER